MATIAWKQKSPIGYWVMPGSPPDCKTMFSAYGKPNLLHRTMMHWLMGWRWEDA